MQLIRRRPAFLLVGMLVGASLVAACDTRAPALCEERMACEDGNDEDIAACEIDFAVQADTASLYGCSEFFDLYVDCAVEESDCDDDRYTAERRCDDELEEYNQCLSDG